jgi:hypothetical protein
VQLIALIMKNCFPALEVRTRVGGATLEEYGEIARAWKSAENRSLAMDLSPRSNADGRPGASFDRDSASYFLDKYFSDAALSKVRVNVPLSSISERGRREQAPVEPSPAVMARRPREEEPTVSLRDIKRTPRSAPAEKKSAALSVDHPGRIVPSPDLDLAGSLNRRSSPPARARRRSAPRATHKSQKTSSPAPTRLWERSFTPLRRFGARIVPVAPIIVGAVLVGIALLCVPLPMPGPSGTQAAAVTGTPAPATTTTVEATPTKPSTAAGPSDSGVYVVREGDSLWRIFTSLKGSEAAGHGWADFLSRATSLNALRDPDRIIPGKVLTLTPPLE